MQTQTLNMNYGNMWKSHVCKDMKSMLHKRGGGSKESSGTFMSNTKCQEIENECRTCRMVTTLSIIQH